MDGWGFYYVVSVSDWGDDGGAFCWGIIIVGVIVGVICVNVIIGVLCVSVIVIVHSVSLNNVDIFCACGDIVIIIVLKIVKIVVIKIIEIIVI